MRKLFLILFLFPIIAQAQVIADTTIYIGNEGDTVKVVNYRNAATTTIPTTTRLKDSIAVVRTLLDGKQATIPLGTTLQYFKGDFSLATFPTTTSFLTSSANKNFVTDAQATVIGNTSGANTGDNAANTTYANDFRAANFAAGTNYQVPITLGDVTTSGATSTIGALKVATGMVQANAITLAKMDATNATARKMLLSQSSASPIWSTETIATPGTSGNLLISDGTNWTSAARFPQQVGTADIAATASATNTTTLVTPSADGMYRISIYMKITTTGTSPIAGPVTITYTDADGSVAQSHVMLLSNVAGAVVTTTVANSTTTGTVTGTMIVNAKSGVAITYAIAVSGTFGAGRYTAHLTCERVK